MWRVVAGLLVCARAWAGSPLPTAETHEVVVVPSAAEPVRGPRFAPITLDVWVQLGHLPSLQAADAARRAVERAPLGDVREVLHVLPWGPPAADLGVWALLEAQTEGRFWAFCDRLLAERNPTFGSAELMRLGRDAGLDPTRLESHLAAYKPRTLQERLMAEARAHESPGRILVNGRAVVGLLNDDTLAQKIDEERPRARALLDDGVPLGRVYERLIDDLHAELAAPEPLQLRARRPRVPVDTTGAPARGPSLAPVTIVVFSNLTCPSCLELAALARRTANAHPGQVRVVWKHWSPPYVPASALTIPAAAEAQGRFWQLHDLLVPARGRPVLASQAGDLEREAQKAGVDVTRMLRDQQAGVLKAIVERDASDVSRLHLLYSPALVVNGVVLTGLQSADVIEDIIAEELARGLTDRLGGKSP